MITENDVKCLEKKLNGLCDSFNANVASKEDIQYMHTLTSLLSVAKQFLSVSGESEEPIRKILVKLHNARKAFTVSGNEFIVDEALKEISALFAKLKLEKEELKKAYKTDGDQWDKARNKWREDRGKLEQQLTSLRERAKGIKVICICGSTKFADIHAIKRWEFEKDGKAICLMINYLPMNYVEKMGWKGHDHFGEKFGNKEILDELHLRKIDLSDEVFVINVGGYIGESTEKEIAYAISKGKPIVYLEN